MAQPAVLDRGGVLAFMDLRQPALGHVLVVPKRHIENIFALDRDQGAELIEAIVAVSRAVRDAFKPDGVSIWQSNGPGAHQEVPHIHFHIMPRFRSDGLLQVYASRPAQPPRDELERQARLIRTALAGGQAS